MRQTWVLGGLLCAVLVACGGEESGGDDGAGGGGTTVSTKFNLWLQPSNFRGFDVGYWNSGETSGGNKGPQDFVDLAATGATVAQIQTVSGTRDFNAPYGTNDEGVAVLDDLVSWCSAAGLSYVIAVREGPGHQSVDVDMAVQTIFVDDAEQQLYAEMLRDDIVLRYRDDPLFVGINVMVEPAPLAADVVDGNINDTDELQAAMTAAGIDINAMNALFIQEIRSVDAELPIVVQGPTWSDPEWFSLVAKQDDPFVIYDFHAYAPRDYTHALECENNLCSGDTYPGSIEGDDWDRDLMESMMLDEVIAFQQAHDVPIFMGEFGMQVERSGGVQFLSDLQDIAVAYGWHHCLWSYRPDTEDPNFVNFDPEKWDPSYWAEVMTWFE